DVSLTHYFDIAELSLGGKISHPLIATDPYVPFLGFGAQLGYHHRILPEAFDRIENRHEKVVIPFGACVPGEVHDQSSIPLDDAGAYFVSLCVDFPWHR